MSGRATDVPSARGALVHTAKEKHFSRTVWTTGASKWICRQAAAFIDGEADVSGDDEGSSDEDAEGADEELSGLIDDATQQPGSVQPRRFASPTSPSYPGYSLES